VVTIAPDGSLWFGTTGGLSHLTGENWKNYTKDEVFSILFIVSGKASPVNNNRLPLNMKTAGRLKAIIINPPSDK